MPARVAEILANGRSGKRGIILQRRRVRGRSRHHHGVIHGAVLPQRLHNGRNGGTLLADSHVNAVHRLPGLVRRALVDNGINGNGRLTRLAVANNKLTLAAANGNHGVDGLDARLQGFAHRLAENDARGLALQRHVQLFPVDGAQAVQRIAQRVYHAAQQLVVHGHGGDAAGTAHHHAFLHQVRGAHHHGAHIVGLQVHHHGHDAVAAVQQLTGLRVVQAIDAYHAVAHLQGFANLLELELVFHVLELPEEDFAHFAGF